MVEVEPVMPWTVRGRMGEDGECRRWAYSGRQRLIWAPESIRKGVEGPVGEAMVTQPG